MAIPTQFSVAKTRKCPLANPSQPVDGANPLTAESIGFISGASALLAKSAGDIGAPSELSAQNESVIDNAVVIVSKNQADINAPSDLSAKPANEIDSPSELVALNPANINNPVSLSAQLASDIDSPNSLSALGVEDINNPTSLSAQPVEDIDNASLFSALSVVTINNLSIATAELATPVDGAVELTARPEAAVNGPSFTIVDRIQYNFINSDNGWTANNATLTPGANALTVQMTGGDLRFIKSGFTSSDKNKNILWIRIKCTSATVNGTVSAFTLNSKHGFASQFSVKSDVITFNQGVNVNVYLNLAEIQDYLSDGMTSLRIDPFEGSLETFEVDHVILGRYETDVIARDEALIDAPSSLIAESAPNIAAPSTLTPSAGTPTSGTFPLNHARILYRNTLAINQGVSANNGASTAINTLKPNTWEKWEFSGGGGITFTLTDARLIDTVCIGAHNIGSQGGGTGVQYSSTLDGDDFVAFATGQDPIDDSAIMYHKTSKVNVRRVRVIVSGGGDFEVGYISAGTALQMQRPFFNGHQPYTDSDVTEYYSNRTESGEIIGRQIRRKGYETTYEWQNIDDGWYRDNIPEFKEYAKIRPMFIAWNLLEYPKDVAFGETTGDIASSMQNGTRTKRSGLSFTLKGV